MHFCPFSELLPFLPESKISDLIFSLFCLTKQLRYTTYSLQNCCSYLGSIKHTYISTLKQTIYKLFTSTTITTTTATTATTTTTTTTTTSTTTCTTTTTTTANKS